MKHISKDTMMIAADDLIKMTQEAALLVARHKTGEKGLIDDIRAAYKAISHSALCQNTMAFEEAQNIRWEKACVSSSRGLCIMRNKA